MTDFRENDRLFLKHSRNIQNRVIFPNKFHENLRAKNENANDPMLVHSRTSSDFLRLPTQHLYCCHLPNQKAIGFHEVEL